MSSLPNVFLLSLFNLQLIYDSYKCKKPAYQGKLKSRPYPTQRIGQKYVGSGPTKERLMRKLRKCPLECRPVEHKNWTSC